MGSIYHFSNCFIASARRANNANHAIGYNLSLGAHSGNCYPDTLLPSTNFTVTKNIKPGRSDSYDSGIEWKKIFSRLPKDTMSVFIFHTDTLTKYPWEEVRDRYMILRRYDLSYDDIVRLYNKHNFPEIPYPPDERMKYMKMYPSYGSK